MTRKRSDGLKGRPWCEGSGMRGTAILGTPDSRCPRCGKAVWTAPNGAVRAHLPSESVASSEPSP